KNRRHFIIRVSVDSPWRSSESRLLRIGRPVVEGMVLAVETRSGANRTDGANRMRAAIGSAGSALTTPELVALVPRFRVERIAAGTVGGRWRHFFSRGSGPTVGYFTRSAFHSVTSSGLFVFGRIVSDSWSAKTAHAHLRPRGPEAGMSRFRANIDSPLP